MAMNPFKQFFGNVKEAEDTDPISIYLAKVEQIIAAINDLDGDQTRAAQFAFGSLIPLNITKQEMAVRIALDEGVGAVAASMESAWRFLRMVQRLHKMQNVELVGGVKA